MRWCGVCIDVFRVSQCDDFKGKPEAGPAKSAEEVADWLIDVSWKAVVSRGKGPVIHK